MTKELEDFKQLLGELKKATDREDYAWKLASIYVNGHLDLHTILLMAMDFADRHPNWISVDSEPKERGNYLVATRHMVCQSEYYPGMNNPWNTPFFPLGNIADVTHWMPLPPPPEKGGKR